MSAWHSLVYYGIFTGEFLSSSRQTLRFPTPGQSKAIQFSPNNAVPSEGRLARSALLPGFYTPGGRRKIREVFS
jgi:hypothetical protein